MTTNENDYEAPIYLEGIYLETNHRGQGFGAHCLAQMTNELLAQADSVCLFANLRNHSAQKCYGKAGYMLREYYDSLHLQTAILRNRDTETSVTHRYCNCLSK